jgi:hypothetical protein
MGTVCAIESRTRSDFFNIFVSFIFIQSTLKVCVNVVFFGHYRLSRRVQSKPWFNHTRNNCSDEKDTSQTDYSQSK